MDPDEQVINKKKASTPLRMSALGRRLARPDGIGSSPAGPISPSLGRLLRLDGGRSSLGGRARFRGRGNSSSSSNSLSGVSSGGREMRRRGDRMPESGGPSRCSRRGAKPCSPASSIGLLSRLSYGAGSDGGRRGAVGGRFRKGPLNCPPLLEAFAN